MAFELNNQNILILLVAAAVIYFLFFNEPKKEKFSFHNKFNPFKTPEAMNTVVRLYEHADYKGQETLVFPGKFTLRDLRNGLTANDSVSSVKVQKGFMLIAFEHDNFEGKYKIITEDMPYIGNDFNDQISSIIVAPYTEQAWKNCVMWHETGSGKHHDWCQGDFNNKYAQHSGQTGEKCAKGFGRGVCQVPDLDFDLLDRNSDEFSSNLRPAKRPIFGKWR